MPQPVKDEQTRNNRKVWAWLSAAIGVILLNVSLAFVSMSGSGAWGWALFSFGLVFLGLALSLMRSPLEEPKS
jgi:hypothetical protein